MVPAAQALRATVRSGTNTFGEPAAVLLRRELMTRCGPFDGTRRYVIDLDYWCRMHRLGDLYALETVATFRVVQSSWSVRLAGTQAKQVRSAQRPVTGGAGRSPGAVTPAARGRDRPRPSPGGQPGSELEAAR